MINKLLNLFKVKHACLNPICKNTNDHKNIFCEECASKYQGKRFVDDYLKAIGDI